MNGIYFVLALGLWVIYRRYQSKLDRYSVDKIIEYNEGSPILERIEEYKVAVLRKSAFKKIAFLSALAYVLVITNFDVNYIDGWKLLVIVSAITAYSIYLLASVTFKSYDLEKLKETERQNVIGNYEFSQRAAAGLLIGSLILGGNWVFQIQENQSREREIASSEVLEVAGTEWCANWWDIDVYETENGYDANKTGGWPCISIYKVKNLYFTSNNKMCFLYSLKATDGPPSQPGSPNIFSYRKHCASEDSWTSDSLTYGIWKKLNSDLDDLRIDLCNTYARVMSEAERTVYC